jgi:lysophospholipid acyltransferase (LPLAT)-like uncharacterized protein
MAAPRHDYEERNVTIASTLAYAGLFVLDKSYIRKNINHKPDLSCIYAVWHGWQYGLLNIFPRKNLHLLISPSLDGEIISRVSEKLGYSTVRGSMKRDGSKALRELLKVLKRGDSIAYTVDGPKGPIYKVKDGVIKIAQMSQKPIVPLVPYVNWKVEAPTWDKYKVPMLFATIKSVFGEPIYVPKHISEEEAEQFRLKLENELFALQKIAENKN